MEKLEQVKQINHNVNFYINMNGTQLIQLLTDTRDCAESINNFKVIYINDLIDINLNRSSHGNIEQLIFSELKRIDHEMYDSTENLIKSLELDDISKNDDEVINYLHELNYFYFEEYEHWILLNN